MPTYVIDGIKYQSDTELSAEELDELSAPKVGADDTAKGDYRAESLRKGITNLPSQIYGAARGAITGTGQTGARQFQKEAQDYLMRLMGGTGAKPETTGQKILAAGLENVGDPTNYAFGVPGLLKSAPAVGKTIYQAGEGLLAGMGAESGGIVGEQTEKKLGGEGGTGRIVGGLLGGMGGNVAAGTGTRLVEPAKAIYSAAAPKIRSLFDSYQGRTPQDEITKEASRSIENIFIAAAASDPNFANTLEAAFKAQAETGVQMPLNAILADNKVIDTAIASLASKNPAFREQYFSQYQAAKASLTGRAGRLFGSPEQSDTILAQRARDIDPMRAVQRKKASIDAEAQRVSREFEQVDPAEFGAKVVKLTEDAEDKARAAVSPLYTRALKQIAPEKGVELSEAQVKDIHDTVMGQQASDLFKTFPSIYRKVKSAFAPQQKEAETLVTEYGVIPISDAKQVFQKATVEDLDSLKREINLQLRNARSDSDVRVLKDLKGKIDDTINSLDPDFVAAYRAADQAYLQKVGLPFNEESIKQINRAKFDENVVPVLTRNKSALFQFLDATGAQGKDLAEQAFISDLTKVAVKDGTLNPAAANAWLKKNASALELVPDVRARIEAAAKDIQSLNNQKNALSDRFVNQAMDRIVQVEGKSAQQIVDTLYRDPTYADKLLGSLNEKLGFKGQQQLSDDGIKAIRSFLLDDIVKSAKPLETLADRSKARVFDRVFGPTYSKKVQQLAMVADRMTRDPSAVAPNLKMVPKGFIEEFTGAPPEMIISRITNPVMSQFYALTSLVSRFMNRQINAAADKEMQRILLDPQAAALLFKGLGPRIDDFKAKEMAEGVTALGKKLGVNFKDMLLRDIGVGAGRSPVGWDQQQEEAM